MMQMAISLAVGIFMGTNMVVPQWAAFCLMGGALLFLYAYWLSKKGWVPFLSISFFFMAVGCLRVQWGESISLPMVMKEWGVSVSLSVESTILDIGLSDTTSSLFLAMLLGHRDMLSPSLVDLYHQAGAFHILALSGLHLGILFGFFNFVLFHLVLFRIRYLIGVGEIVFLWIYTLVAGFPVSLCRASLMLTVFLIGQMRLVGNNGIHALGFAAFLLLLIAPHSLYDVGFQLSFMAMAGLLFLYPLLTKIWQPRHNLPRWAYNAFLLSLSAQITTFPLLLYYFHSFIFSSIFFSPVYILLATAILYSAMLLLLLHPIGATFLLSPSVECLVGMQHSIMSFVSCIPFGNIEHFRFSVSQLFFYYLALLCLLPVLYVLRKPDVSLPKQRLAMFFRSWPYLLAAILLLSMTLLLSV